MYKEVKQDEAVKFRGLSSEDLLVYQIIQQSGNTGIWTKELKQKSNLPQTQISKIFKSLEARKLIKAVKHVAQQNRKVYMLYELEPSREITGGAWYTEHEYDAEFISVLRDQCVKFILSRGKVTLEDVCEFVRKTKLSHVELGQEEVLQIVNTPCTTAKWTRTRKCRRTRTRIRTIRWGRGTMTTWITWKTSSSCTRASLPIPESSAFTAVPCGVCPVFSECARRVGVAGDVRVHAGMARLLRCPSVALWREEKSKTDGRGRGRLTSSRHILASVVDV